MVEATSGNTDIMLSMGAVTKDYKIPVVMPDPMTEERTKVLRGIWAAAQQLVT